MGKELDSCGRGREYGSYLQLIRLLHFRTNPRGSQTCQDSLLGRNVIRVGESSRAWLQYYLFGIQSTKSSTLL